MKTKQSMLWLTLLTMVVTLFGCASVTRVDLLKTNVDGTAWSIRDTEIESYKFSTPGIMLYTCPAILRVVPISMGPALVPIIPTPSRPNSVSGEAISFEFAFAVESLAANTTIDFANILLTLPDGEILNPNRVMTWHGTEKAHVSCNILYDDKQVPIDQFVVTNSARYFKVRFPISPSNVELCTIELGAVRIDGKKVDVPPLRFKKGSDYKFRPFVLPLPS